MKTPAKGSCLLGLVVLVGLVGPLRAAERPLLVVVEAPPALDVDAAEVRRAIGIELRCETVAPTKTPGDPPERALIVALDRNRITVSLRAGDLAPVTRSIPTPPEPAARLRAIVWLAGNLARDQVSPIVAASVNAPGLPPIPDLPQPAPSPSGDSPTSPASAPPIEPPPFETTETTLTSHFNPATTRRSPWTIGVAAGPAIGTYDLAHSLRQSIFGSWNASSVGDVFSHTTTTWRVELRHRTDGSRLFTGLVVEGATASDNLDYGNGTEILGAAGLVGSTLQFGRWSLEASFGAGVDLDQQMTAVFTITMSSTNGNTTSLSQASETRPGLFAAGTVAVSHPVFESVDAVLSLNAHVSIIDEYDGYLAALLGLRYNL